MNDELMLNRLRELTATDRRYLRFPDRRLEADYRRFHRDDVLAWYRRYGLSIAILTFLLILVGALTEPLEDILYGVAHPLTWHRGMPLAVAVMLACMFSLPVLARRQRLARRMEAWFVPLTSVALAAVLMALVLVETVWMQYLWVLGVLYGYVILHALSRQRTTVRFCVVALSFLLMAGVSHLIGIEPDWRLVGSLGLGVNLLGGMLGYIDETRDRAHYLQENLVRLEQQEMRRLSDRIARDNRVKERVNALHEVMSAERDLVRLATRIVHHLVPELGVQIAVLYHLRDTTLHRLAASGLDDDAGTHGETLALGENLVGQCAKDGRPLFIDQAPPGYLAIRSGTGECVRPALALMPLRHNDRIHGVLEVAALKPLDGEDRRLLEAVAPSIGIALSSVWARQRETDAS